MAFLIHGLIKRGQYTYTFIRQIGIHPYTYFLSASYMIATQTKGNSPIYEFRSIRLGDFSPRLLNS